MDHLAKLRASLSGQYTIDRELGGGGMSRVYAAEETRLRRKVVIKVVSPEMAQGLSVERFEREIQLAASLSQANIVPVLSAGDTDGLPYFTMPYVDGESLRHHLARGPMPVADVINIIRDVARALSYAHKHNIVHRDIKPDNVLLSSGAAVVTDFGIAKALVAARTQADSATLTQTGMAIGTAAYMAPEQAAGDPDVDQRADIYSLGCMAYELLTGAPPFVRETSQRVLAAQLTEAPAAITTRRHDTPPSLAALVMRCLEKDPAHRPQSGEEVFRLLDAASSGDVPVRVRGLDMRGTRPLFLMIPATMIVILVAMWFAFRHRGNAGVAVGARSLAVLPIENVGGDSSKEYLADGMASELASSLRQTQGLTVVGDLSTSRFKHTTLAATDIASQLHVGMLLSGRMQSSGQNIRLQMQLNDASGKLLWSQKYDREAKDNFVLQDEITAAIAREMQIVLSPAATVGRTENPAAYDLYMHGMFEKNKLDSLGLGRAVEYFKQALTIDPHFARAHAAMGFAYDILADGFAPSHEYHTLALQQGRLALADDSMLAEARVLNGFELAAANWDFEGGLAEMNRGLALNPRSPDAMVMIAMFSLLSGNPDRAVRLGDSITAVDPLSPIGLHAKAEGLLWGGHWAEALAAKQAAKKIDPNLWLIDATDGRALLELGRKEEALATFLAFKNATRFPSYGLAATYGALNRTAEARALIQWMIDQRKVRWVDADFIAIAYAEIGDRDNAMKWFTTAFEQQNFGTRLLLGWDCPWLKNMKGDPRFVALQAKAKATRFNE